MIKNQIFIMLIAGVALFFSSCYKDSGFENQSTTNTFGPEILKEINGSILGYVYDNNDRPIAGAIVNIYSGATETDDFGVFRFDNVLLDEHGTYIQVKKAGYMMGSDKIYPNSGVAMSRIQIIALRNDKTFSANSGGVVSMDNGGSITFKANSIIDANSNEYTGEVEVTAQFLSPDRVDLGEVMPGNLVGEDKEGKTVVLGTAGMIAVELRSAGGDELNLRPGTNATISMPASNVNWPSDIPTWSFDENLGIWKEESSAIKSGDKYVFEVSHFSFWNCDYPFPLVTVSGRVINTDGDPVLTLVTVRSENYGVEYTHTDSDGFFSGKVPSGEVLTFTSPRFYCGQHAFSANLGPFDNTTVLNDFVVDGYLPKVSGNVLCVNTPYSDATIVIEANGKRHIYNVIESGSFTYNPNVICETVTSGSIFAYDNQTQKISQVYALDFENPIVPDLEVCEIVCDFDAILSYNCGDPLIDISIINPDGNYLYQWDDGSSMSQVNVSTSQTELHCVTVTEESTGCEQSFCQETGNLSLNLSYDLCNNIIIFSFPQGSPPYSVMTNGNSFVINSQFYAYSVFSTGTYCFDITDKIGCQVSACEDVMSIQTMFPYIDSDPYNCQLNRYYYNAFDFNFGNVTGPQGQDQLLFDINGYYINVARVGYKDIDVFLDGMYCSETFNVTTPFFSGLQSMPTVTNTTCTTCSDGQIIYTFDSMASCKECQFGEVNVYDENFIDVTTENDAAALSTGTYYVAAIDLNTGCFIASHQVIVDSN